jgi:hypothetical protein
MKYKIKSGDTLSKLAQQFGIKLEVILAHNPAIKDPNKIFVGQVINISLATDVPEGSTTHQILPSALEVIARAKTAIGKGIRYDLGGGGKKPTSALPDDGTRKCDCSGFVCWVLGLPRQTDQAFYKKYKGWIYTDSMEDDILSNAGIFRQLSVPEPGCIIVYGAGPKKIGHVGLVSEVEDGEILKVIHCSVGNDNRFQDSIQETDGTVFNRSDVKFGWYVGLED